MKNQENPLDFNRVGMAGRLGPRIWQVKSPKISEAIGHRPAGGRPEAGGPQKSHFRQLASGLSHGDGGTPCFFHTFQRRSNRGRATILDQSSDGDEISVKGKSLVPPISGPPTGAANGSNVQSETSMFRMEENH